MSENTTQIVPAIPQAKPVPVTFGRMGVELATLEDAYRFATAISKSGFAPKGMESVESILIAVQFGAELGLPPMAALQSLAIINGRPSIYGDAALGLVRGSGLLESYQQSTSGEGDSMKAIVRVKRKDEVEIVSEFSVADAKKANLWGKAGPWSQYPARMLMWRARGFALRDGFGDVLRGLATAEENQDLPNIMKTAKVVLPVAKEEKEAVLPEPLTIVDKTPESVPVEVVNAATNPSKVLGDLIAASGLKFEDIKAIIKPQRLCATNAASAEDMTEENCRKVIADFDIISSAAKAERLP